MKYRITALIALVLVGMPVFAMANPVRSDFGPLIIIPILLFLEGIIICALTKSSLMYRGRFVSVWFFVTLLTWIPFTLIMNYLEPFAGRDFGTAVGEIFVTIIEAGAIWLMLRAPFFARHTGNPLSFMRSLYYSAVANLISFGGRLLSLLI